LRGEDQGGGETEKTPLILNLLPQGEKGEYPMKKNIEKLKKEKGAVILAHNYQLPEIQELADFTGDSLELARKSAELDCKTLIFCGVKFMAETAKILSPGKKVLLPEIDAGCPLADTAEPDKVLKLKEKHPDAWIVSYVNTSAEIKAITDVCCTSANAEKVVRNVPAEEIIFLPDKNLCSYVRKRVPEKRIICWDGYCYVHRRFTPEEVKQAREAHPDAEIIVHPECDPAVQELADGIYSTSGMLRRAKETRAKKLIIGTEEGMLFRIKKEVPDKEIYSLGSPKICYNMKKITLQSLESSLEKDRYEIALPEDIMKKARLSLERMIKYI